MVSRLYLALVLTLAASTPLTAQSVAEDIAAQLRAQGYEQVQMSRTWLGRLRFLATTGLQTREIIVNPRTGEILRDFMETSAEGGSVRILDRPAPEGRPPTRTDAGAARPETPGRGPDAGRGGPGSGPGGGQGGGQGGAGGPSR
ncbi:MAG: hypothetical protein AAF891_02985 [Pseudomonadota bacterium]